MLHQGIKKIFDRVVELIFGIILAFIIIGLAIGALKLFVSVWSLLSAEGITGHYIDLIADVLTLYVVVELSRSLTDYFTTHKLQLTFIADAAIIFIIREILIGLFKHELKPEMLYPLSLLLLVLGALRIGSILIYQREKAASLESGHPE